MTGINESYIEANKQKEINKIPLNDGWYLNGERWDDWDKYCARLQAELRVLANLSEQMEKALKYIENEMSKNENGLPF